jgi:hypothetical protein
MPPVYVNGNGKRSSATQGQGDQMGRTLAYELITMSFLENYKKYPKFQGIFPLFFVDKK